MAWDTSKTQIRTSVSVSGTTWGNDSSIVTLTPGETIDLQLEGVFPNPATDDLEFRVLKSLDDTTEVWDTEAYLQGTIEKSNGATKRKGFTVFGVKKFKLQFRLSGATDSVTVQAWMVSDNINL